MGKSTVVCVSDGCLLPLMVASSKTRFPSVKQLFTVESSPHCSRLIKEVSKPLLFVKTTIMMVVLLVLLCNGKVWLGVLFGVLVNFQKFAKFTRYALYYTF